MLTKHTVILLVAVAVSVQAAVDQLMLTKPRDASGLENLGLEALYRIIEDLVSRLEHLESMCISTKGNVGSGDNENESVSEQSDFVKANSLNQTDKHTVFARSDDNDPLIPVVAQMTERLNEVSASVQTLNNEMVKASTSVFVRWGCSTCPSSATLVYSGVAGGSSYYYYGSAANSLCLPLSDVNLYYRTARHHANLYGTQYKTDDGHNGKGTVCAVCRASRPTTVMIPATTTCPAGWTAEYGGFLMGGNPSDYAASEFICVDVMMEERQGNEDEDDGRFFYYTQTACGSLPCPPYVTERTVTCVVCSK